jgi:hypothetical protein
MRCPCCRTEIGSEDLVCGQCGSRTFAWLGDPFGLQEPPPRLAGRPAATTLQPSRSGWSSAPLLGKLILLLLLIGAALEARLLVLVLAGMVGLVMLWRWQQISWARFLILLSVLWLAGWL